MRTLQAYRQRTGTPSNNAEDRVRTRQDDDPVSSVTSRKEVSHELSRPQATS